MVREEYEKLLKSWCDGMLSCQIHDKEHRRFHGGLMCPACQRIHGRSADAVYPLLYMADRTGEEKYLNGALDLFDWGETVVCEDGSVYNDAQGQWTGITVFSAMSIFHALEYHGHLLDESTRGRFESRLKAMAEWIDATITPEFVTNINYHATAAALLAVTGKFWNNQGYLEHAAVLAASCKRHILEEGLFYGEGKPMELVTPRGCRPVDLGYNVEESIPSMLTYARCIQDEEMLKMVEHLLETHLEFMLPDGGWDNSFGTRNFKWTYWGSRTSDGCQSAYGCWNGEKPVFEEAARRNLELYERCTAEGLLYGGPDYRTHGEEPCIHHSFCHAKALAEVLDYGIKEPEGDRPKLPSECAVPVKYFPVIDTYRLAVHGFLATVTGYDFEYLEGGHASGGVMTMLWHEKTGPVFASSMTDYSMREVFNMQLTLKKRGHEALTPTVELWENGVRYAQCYDYRSHMEVSEKNGNVIMMIWAELVSVAQESPSRRTCCEVVYELQENLVKIWGHIAGEGKRKAVLVLPVIGRHENGCERTEEGNRIRGSKGSFLVKTSNEMKKPDPEPIFFLTPGLEAWKFEILPDASGNVAAEIQI
jgi:hypothetical protein